MTDNALFTLVRTIILSGLESYGLTGWQVARKFQPVQQGANTGPTVYLFKIGDVLHGSPRASYRWRADLGTMGGTHAQQCVTSFQASILMDESTDPAALTQSDVANMVAAIIQSDEAMAALRAQQVGLLRVTAVRNPYDVNDRDQFDAEASFDFSLTHRRAYEAVAPSAVGIGAGIHRV